MRSASTQTGRQNRSGETSDPAGFLSDVKTLRARARNHIDEGAVTDDYGMNAKAAVKILNDALATELVCTLRFRQHAYGAKGSISEPIAQEFLLHSNELLADA